MDIDLGWAISDGVIDGVELEPHGMVRINGWCLRDELPACTLVCDGIAEHPDASYRRARQDVCDVHRSAGLFTGFAIEFRRAQPAPFDILLDNRRIVVDATHAARLAQHQPEYIGLLDGDAVLHRDDIYGVGPPIDWVHPDILALARQLPSPVLDFGCGNGALVRALRSYGIEAYGLELDSERIRTSLREDVAGYITLYDGNFPAPFTDGQFESVVSSEVVEHIPAYETAIAEIARLCRSRFAITVPDMSCIPIGHRHGFVPWHLMESTHVNFFNHHSLARVLEPHFTQLDFYQLAGGRMNGTFVPGSLGVIARRA
jgi:SAM-dependent methyltransferase